MTDHEREAKKLETLLEHFKRDERIARQRVDDEGDSEFWFSVAFANRAQKAEFLQLLGLDGDEKHITGRELAEGINVALAPMDPPNVRLQRVHQQLTEILQKI